MTTLIMLIEYRRKGGDDPWVLLERDGMVAVGPPVTADTWTRLSPCELEYRSVPFVRKEVV